MSQLLHQFIQHQAQCTPDAPALGAGKQWLSYNELQQQVTHICAQLLNLGLEAQQRVAIYLPKSIANVISLFAVSRARGIFVPINPVLKGPQAQHILQDCEASILITNQARWAQVCDDLPDSVKHVVLTDPKEETHEDPRLISWQQLLAPSVDTPALPLGLETDLAAIFYTSGSTGKPKGVMLTQRNMVLGATSVASYLENRADDRLLAVQPLSFDYGFSQLTIAFSTGASIYLMEYLFPQDVIKQVVAQRITALALVPPLWIKLANYDWPAEASANIRYFTNTGGAMPQATLDQLRTRMPNAKPFLMYGLTEAFRSCYLPPEEIDRRPGSFGKAIPNAEILVVDQDGCEVPDNQPGELVHKGALVSPGYWNDPHKTAIRFKPAPNGLSQRPSAEMAVWSGDIVTRDEDGFLYFVGRNDEMIKTSGYRLSPTEIEEVLYSSELVAEAVAIGAPHPELGQAVVLLVVPKSAFNSEQNETVYNAKIRSLCLKQLPSYMQPQHIVIQESFPRNPNGKIDRKSLSLSVQSLFVKEA